MISVTARREAFMSNESTHHATTNPSIITTRVIARRARLHPAHAARFFSYPAVSSIIFLLSALCLLGGAYTVFAGLGDDDLQLPQRFAMVAAVHGYELALGIVAIILCSFQRANNDAIGPLILAAAFLIGSSVTLDLVSIDAPWWTLSIGFTSLAILLGKYRALRYLDNMPATNWWLMPLLGLAAFNLLYPGLLGLQRHYSDSSLYTQWWYFPAWMAMLLCAVFFLVGLAQENDLHSDRYRPLIRRALFRWILGMIIVACSAVHLFVLGFVQNIDVSLGELLPFIGVLAVMSVGLRYRAAQRHWSGDNVILWLPIMAAGLAIYWEDVGFLSNVHGDYGVLTPSIFCLLYAGMLLMHWRHTGQFHYYSAALAAVVGSVWWWGADANLLSWNYHACILAMSGVLVAEALRMTRVDYIMAAIVIGMAELMWQPEWKLWLWSLGLSRTMGTLMIGGVLMLAVAWVVPFLLSRRFYFLMLTGIIITVLYHNKSGALSGAAFLWGIFLVVIHAVSAWRRRDYLLFIPLLCPVSLALLHLLPSHKGWIAVISTFALLIIGTVVSYVRVQQVKKRPRVPSPTIDVSALEPMVVQGS
jgi:hypothetical protein